MSNPWRSLSYHTNVFLMTVGGFHRDKEARGNKESDSLGYGQSICWMFSTCRQTTEQQKRGGLDGGKGGQREKWWLRNRKTPQLWEVRNNRRVRGGRNKVGAWDRERSSERYVKVRRRGGACCMLCSDVYEERSARSAPHRSLFPLFIPVSHKNLVKASTLALDMSTMLTTHSI